MTHTRYPDTVAALLQIGNSIISPATIGHISLMSVCYATLYTNPHNSTAKVKLMDTEDYIIQHYGVK